MHFLKDVYFLGKSPSSTQTTVNIHNFEKVYESDHA